MPVRRVRVVHDGQVGPFYPGAQEGRHGYRGGSLSVVYNPRRALMPQLGDGIAEMRTISDARKALKSVGFEILHEEDLADRESCGVRQHDVLTCRSRGHDPVVLPPRGRHPQGPDPLGQYVICCFVGVRADARRVVFMCFRSSKYGQMITQNGVWALEKIGLVPKGTHDIGASLGVAATHLVAGGKTKLFT